MDRQKSMKTGNLFQLARRSNFPAPLFLTGVCYWGSSAQKPSPANSPGPFSPTLDSLFLPLPLSSRGVDSQSTLGYHHGYSNRGAFQFPIASEHEPFLSAFESRARSVELTAASTRLVGGQLGGHWSSRRWNVAVCSVLWTFLFLLSLSLDPDGWILDDDCDDDVCIVLSTFQGQSMMARGCSRPRVMVQMVRLMLHTGWMPPCRSSLARIFGSFCTFVSRFSIFSSWCSKVFLSGVS